MKKFFLFIVAAVMAAFSSFASAQNPNDITETEFKAALKIVNASLPMDVDDGFVWEKVTDGGKNVIFTFKFDESDFSASTIELVKTELKEALMESFATDPDMRDMLQMLATLNKGVTLSFIGASSGQSVNITATAAEVKRLIGR